MDSPSSASCSRLRSPRRSCRRMPPPRSSAPSCSRRRCGRTSSTTTGGWHPPFVYPLRLVSRLEQRYEEDRSRRMPLALFSSGVLVSVDRRDRAGPAARSAPTATAATSSPACSTARGPRSASRGRRALGALLLGTARRRARRLPGRRHRRRADAVRPSSCSCCPPIYVVLALRAVLPLVLPAWVVFVLMAGIFALVGWPFVARGVRAIVAAERRRDYATAAASLGAGPRPRCCSGTCSRRPSASSASRRRCSCRRSSSPRRRFRTSDSGFPIRSRAGGRCCTMPRRSTNLADFPWTLSPAAAIFLVVLALNLVLQGSGRSSCLHLGRPV